LSRGIDIYKNYHFKVIFNRYFILKYCKGKNMENHKFRSIVNSTLIFIDDHNFTCYIY
jgi:hypothetical protein